MVGKLVTAREEGKKALKDLNLQLNMQRRWKRRLMGSSKTQSDKLCKQDFHKGVTLSKEKMGKCCKYDSILGCLAFDQTIGG